MQSIPMTTSDSDGIQEKEPLFSATKLGLPPPEHKDESMNGALQKKQKKLYLLCKVQCITKLAFFSR